jgi:periplasmic copper chaperone A
MTSHRNSPARPFARPLARLGLLAAAATAMVVLAAVPALAHVTVHADSTAPGGEAKITFRVPTEVDNASTIALRVALPRATPIASVAVQPHAGWTFRVTRARLAKPIPTDDGPVSTAVTEITWTAASAAVAIKPGEFDEFSISAEPLPRTAVLRFPALQTYSDGRVVRWIEVAAPGAPEPEHPAPTLALTPAGPGSSTGTPATSSHRVVASASTSSGSTAALALSIVALFVALLGTAGAVLALRSGRRRL